MSDTMPTAAVELMGAIVSQNVRDLAHTTDLIIDGLERDIVEIGSVLAAVINAVDDASVIDKATQRRIDMLDVRIACALDIYRRKAEKI